MLFRFNTLFLFLNLLNKNIYVKLLYKSYTKHVKVSCQNKNYFSSCHLNNVNVY